MELMARLRDGDKDVFNQIFNCYWERLFKMAYRVLLDENLAKDVVQEILMDLWDRRKKAQILDLNAYLVQAVKYKVAYHLRRGKFTQVHFEKMESLTLVNTTEETIHYNELERTILESIAHLPKRCREIFYLSRFKGLRNKEIAERLNVSIRTVETQISKALKQLRTEIRPNIIGWIMLVPWIFP